MTRMIPLSLLLIVTTLWGLGQEERPTGTLRIAVPRTVSSAPFFVLQDTIVQGHRVEVEIYDDHPLALTEFLAGRYDVLFTGYQLGLGRWEADRGVRHLGTVVWGVSSLVVTNPSLQGIASLAGKRVLVPFAGSPLEVQLKALLRGAGILDRVTIDYSPITQMPALLLQGRADAICVPEPIVSRLESQGQARALFSFASEWGRLTGDPRSPQVSLFVRSADLPARLELFQELRALIKQRAEGLFRDADVERIAQRLELPPALIVRALGNTLFGLPDNPTQLRLLQGYHSQVGEATVISADFLVP